MTAAHEGDRHTCPKCGRSIALSFGGARLLPHNTGKGGPRCDGSRMPLGEVLAAEQPPQPLRIAVDADCPSCGKPERSFDPARGVFGCSSLGGGPCGYESTERDA